LTAHGLPSALPANSGSRVHHVKQLQSRALPMQVRRSTLALAIAGACLAYQPLAYQPALAANGITIAPEIAAKLTPPQLATYRTYLIARSDFERQAQVYWTLVDERRENRRKKHSQQKPYTADDYVLEQPLKYTGPALPPDVAALVTAAKPVEPDKPMAALTDFLANAKNQFNFVPERTTEHEFKRRYAADALAAGLSKDQVIRVYALETGGRGTFDMQAGIDPETRQGRPISSAMGYAQLLSANSSNELVRHGEQFIAPKPPCCGR
jgi:hypothetical protein